MKLEDVLGKKVTRADLVDAVSVLSKRLYGHGQFYQPESVSPDKIIIKLSTKSKKSTDALAMRRMRKKEVLFSLHKSFFLVKFLSSTLNFLTFKK